MISLISCGSCFTHAAILRLCFGLIFAGMAIAAHTAQSEENPFAPELEILTIQPVRASTDWPFTYRLDTSIALTRSEDNAPVGSGASNTPRLHIIAEPKKEAAWSKKAHWQISPDNNNASLSPILRFESKGERFEIKPQRHSIWVRWHKAFP
jgi:hypothetical protein